jgi:predicted permease
VTNLRRFGRRIVASVWPDRRDDELRDEIASHIAEAADEYVRRGLSPEDARLAALRSFGGVTQTQQIHREMRTLGWLDDLHHDLRYTARVFARNRAFTLVATLTLAIGIGANTAIFTLLDAVMFKPLPLSRPGELIALYETGPEGTADPTGGTGRYLRFSYGRFERLQQALGSQGSLAAVTRSAGLILRLPGETDRRFIQAQFVSGTYFATLGVSATRGRTIGAEDVRLDRPSPVAVISDAFWHRSLGGSEDVLGRTIVVNNVVLTIVGVTPPGFGGLWTDDDADAWLPVTLQQPLHHQTNSSAYGPIDSTKPWMVQDIAWLNLVGRVPRDGLGALPVLQAANRDGVMQLAATMQDARSRDAMRTHTLVIESFAHGFSGLRGRYADALFALTAMVALVLLVTCATIANLLLARATARARDISLRLSLGATTSRLVRQCLTESVALALIGGAGGAWISQWASRALARQVLGSSGQLPLIFRPDVRVFAFAAGISMASAIVFGLAPAFSAVAAGRRATLGGNQRMKVGHATTPMMRWLVVGQLALSVVLVSAAMLLGRTLVNFMRIDPGFSIDGLVTVSLDPHSSGYPPDQLPMLAARLVATAAAVPGVASAAASTCGLIAGCSSSGGFLVEGVRDESVPLFRNWVTPGYFATTGIPLVAGRDFSEHDTATAPRVAIVNQTLAARYFPGRSAIGKRIGGSQLDIEIIAVVRAARTQSLHAEPVAMAYFPVAQKPIGPQPSLTNLDVRIAATNVRIEPALRDAIRRSEPNLLVGDVGAMSRRLARDLTRERLVAWLALAFGTITLFLAALGLYGVLSYAVNRRTQEIGVRLALGARPMEVLALVAGQSARLVLIGIAVGLGATAVASRYLSGLLLGVTPLDPATFVFVPLAFVAVSVLASLIPVRRAIRVDPLVALRGD